MSLLHHEFLVSAIPVTCTMHVQCSVSSNPCQPFSKDEKTSISVGTVRPVQEQLFVSRCCLWHPLGPNQCVNLPVQKKAEFCSWVFIYSETAEVGRGLSTNSQGFRNRTELSVSNPADNYMLIKFDPLIQCSFLKPPELVLEVNLGFSLYFFGLYIS